MSFAAEAELQTPTVYVAAEVEVKEKVEEESEVGVIGDAICRRSLKAHLKSDVFLKSRTQQPQLAVCSILVYSIHKSVAHLILFGSRWAHLSPSVLLILLFPLLTSRGRYMSLRIKLPGRLSSNQRGQASS